MPEGEVMSCEHGEHVAHCEDCGLDLVKVADEWRADCLTERAAHEQTKAELEASKKYERGTYAEYGVTFKRWQDAERKLAALESELARARPLCEAAVEELAYWRKLDNAGDVMVVDNWTFAKNALRDEARIYARAKAEDGRTMFSCCGGSDEDPPEHCQDCPDGARGASKSRDDE
jgi:hypothetical protein